MRMAESEKPFLLRNYGDLRYLMEIGENGNGAPTRGQKLFVYQLLAVFVCDFCA